MTTSNQVTKITYHVRSTSYHVRSTSLPSASHPLLVIVEERLERLKSSQSTSSSSHVSICHSSSILVDLFDSVDDVLQLSQSHHGKRVEEVLDGSIRLLGLCGTIRDAFSQMKESVQKLESSLRRKRGDYGLSNEVGAYMVSRKQLNKLICKIFGDLKRMEKSYTTSLEKDSLSSMLEEIEGISLSVFDSLLSFISQPKARSKTLSFISKLLQSKQVSCEGEADIKEVEKLDIDLLILNSKRSTKHRDLQQVQNVLKKLQALEMNIQELEEGLEAVFRRLVKTRVSLLNILNN